MMQPTANTWQPPTQNTWQPPTANMLQQCNESGGEKKEIALLKEKVDHLVVLLANSQSIIRSTSVANSGKKFILDKNFSITSPKSLNSVEIGKSWILDSGATDHMTPIYDFFSSYIPCTMNRKVQTANGTLLTVSGIGTIKLKSIGTLEHVLHVPQLFISLVFVQKIASLAQYKIEFHRNNAFLCNKVQGWRTGLANVHNGLYYLASAQELSPKHIINPEIHQCSTADADSKKEKVWLIHNRLGHPSFEILKCMSPDEFKGFCIKDFLCDVCERAKHKRGTYSSQNIERRKHLFHLLHLDVWGPAPSPDLHGFKWFLIIVDDFSRFTWTYLLRHKSEVTMKFKHFSHMIERRFETKIKVIRTDNTKDFLNHEFHDFCVKTGIIHETSCAYTPQQNGVAERRIEIIQERARALLINSNAPSFLWGEAMLTSTFLTNRIVSQNLDKQSPLKLITTAMPLGISEKVGHELPLKVFGCECYVHLYPNQTNKLSSRAIKCVFVG